VDGAARHPLWVREEEVLNTDDRGLLSVAADPDYVHNHYLYFLYTVDPDSDGIELNNADDAFARLTRYRLSATDSNTVDYSTRTILLGATWREGFASGSGTHTIADLAWGRDGSLLVSAGDGAHFEVMDPGGLDPGMFTAGRTDSSEDVGAFRSQDLTSLDGKVLRIDPATGWGYPSNPYFDGDPASHRSRVWAYGLRNPFRMTRKPGTGSLDPALGDPGTLYLGEVGWQTWEEVDVVNAPGLDFGWPCYEGLPQQPDYQAATPLHSGCGTIGTLENPGALRPPTVSIHHWDDTLSTPPGHVGLVVAGGVFYEGAGYPQQYRRRYFFGDYGASWIKMLTTNALDEFVSVEDFAGNAGGPVSFAADPVSGDLYYVSIYTGQVRRIRYTGTVSAGSAPPRESIALSPARPDPSRGPIAFDVDLPRASRVAFGIFDVAGRVIWRAPARELGAGRSLLLWPGITSAGSSARPGVYLARVDADGRTLTRRFVEAR
jgi:glucose/arabinose dehydrogenase